MLCEDSVSGYKCSNLGLASTDEQCHDSCTGMTDGEQIAWRRERLGWNQRKLAKQAGVGLSTVTRIEKDRNTQQVKLRAVLQALDLAEADRPDLLSHAPSAQSAPQMKEGADHAAIIAEAHGKIAGIAGMLDGALKDLRQTLARLDPPQDQSKKQA